VPLRRNEVLCGKRNRIREVDSGHDLEKTVCKTGSNHRRRHHGISPCLYPAVTCGLGKKTVIHPNVDNLRVVGITDPGMTKGVEPKAPWSRQDELVKQKVVWENIDRLACTLTKSGDPVKAWETIFVRPLVSPGPRRLWPSRPTI